eukprot:gene16661-biopygen11475
MLQVQPCRITARRYKAGGAVYSSPAGRGCGARLIRQVRRRKSADESPPESTSSSPPSPPHHQSAVSARLCTVVREGPPQRARRGSHLVSPPPPDDLETPETPWNPIPFENNANHHRRIPRASRGGSPSARGSVMGRRSDTCAERICNYPRVGGAESAVEVCQVRQASPPKPPSPPAAIGGGGLGNLRTVWAERGLIYFASDFFTYRAARSARAAAFPADGQQLQSNHHAAPSGSIGFFLRANSRCADRRGNPLRVRRTGTVAQGYRLGRNSVRGPAPPVPLPPCVMPRLSLAGVPSLCASHPASPPCCVDAGTGSLVWQFVIGAGKLYSNKFGKLAGTLNPACQFLH